jgi:hypothetical protein
MCGGNRAVFSDAGAGVDVVGWWLERSGWREGAGGELKGEGTRRLYKRGCLGWRFSWEVQFRLVHSLLSDEGTDSG